MWLHLEAGTARALRVRWGIAFDVPPSSHPDGMGWHPLVVVAAETYFPEAGIEDLPMWAAVEVARVLSGPLRNRIATTEPDETELIALRDNLMIALGATPDTGGAVSLVDRIHADRLLRSEVPPIIAARCLAWYGHWRDGSETARREITKVAKRCVDDWIAHPDQRSAIDAHIVELAENIAGSPNHLPLEERAV